MTFLRRSVALALALLAAGCGTERAAAREGPREDPGSEPEAYSFFVAGHVYGDPRAAKEPGLHPPFRAKLGWLAERPGMAFGVLTGDVVRFPRSTFWDVADEELAAFGLPVHVAPGNHDIGWAPRENAPPERIDREEWMARYGPTYRAFEHGGDLFVLLDPNLDGWSITGGQLAFLDEQLARARSCRNVFLFMHQVVWSDLARPERAVVTNSGAGRAPEVNFADEIEPRLVALGRPVYAFAGDVGATAASPPFWYRREGNLHLVASGMGLGERDNLIVVHVAADGAVDLELIALRPGDPPDALGRLEDHPANRL